MRWQRYRQSSLATNLDTNNTDPWTATSEIRENRDGFGRFPIQ
ncbi:hypothetical protein J2X34_001396 [Rhodococcus sp. BE178]